MRSSPARVLVVDDVPINQKIATRLLERLGYKVGIVSNGLEAVRAAQTGAYAAIFMDVQMPVMDGLEATEVIRRWEREPGPGTTGRRLPIFAVTTSPDRASCLAAGMDDFLAKPLSLSELERALDRWLGRGAFLPGSLASVD